MFAVARTLVSAAPLGSRDATARTPFRQRTCARPISVGMGADAAGKSAQCHACWLTHFHDFESSAPRRLMEKRFGPIPPSVEGRLLRCSQRELEEPLDGVLDAPSLDDLMTCLGPEPARQLILYWHLVGVIDHQHVDRVLAGLKLQSQLLLDGCINRRAMLGRLRIAP